MKRLGLLATLALAACADAPPADPAPRPYCPDLPLMSPQQTTRGYIYQLMDMYNTCAGKVNKQ